MSTNPARPSNLSREQRRLAQLERTTSSPRELAARVAGTSEATAGLFDSGQRNDTELGAPLSGPGDLS